jgi:hypothetical protein
MPNSFKSLLAVFGLMLFLSCNILPEAAPTAFKTTFVGESIQSVKARDRAGIYYIEDASLAAALDVFLKKIDVQKNKIVTAKLDYLEFIIPEESKVEFNSYFNTKLVLKGISTQSGILDSVAIVVPEGKGKVNRLEPERGVADKTYDVTKALSSRNLSCYAIYCTRDATPATKITMKYRFELSFSERQ